MTDETKNNGFVIDGIWHLTPRECYEECKKAAVIIDVREEYMNRFKQFGVDNLIFCPFSLLVRSFEKLPEGELLIFADATGLKSRESVILAQKIGLKNVANMAGGMVEWERDALPLIIDKSNRLSGSCMCQLKFRDKK